MGLFSGISDFLFGGGDSDFDFSKFSDAGVKGAEDFEKFGREGIEELRKALSGATGELSSFSSAGRKALADLLESSTTGGLDKRLGRIFDLDAFKNLRGERARDIEGALSAQGFSRSGKTIEEFANLSPELGFSIENLLSGRSRDIASQGLNAATTSAGFRQGTGRGIADILGRTGQAFFQGRQSDAQRELSRLLGKAGIESQERGQNIGLFGDIIGAGATLGAA